MKLMISRSSYFLEELNRGSRQISVDALLSEMRAICNFIYKGRVCQSGLFDIQKVNILAETLMIQNWIPLTKNIPNLPTEVLVKIFSYMTTFECLRKVSLVCHRFHDIVSSQPDVFKVIQIILPKSSMSMRVLLFVNDASKCEELYISLKDAILDHRDASDHLHLLCEVNACIPKLKHLKVFDVGDGIVLPEKSFNTLIRLGSFTKLSKLRVQVRLLVGSATRFDSSIAALAKSETLTSIDFKEVMPFETRHLVQLALGCSRLKSISPSVTFDEEVCEILLPLTYKRVN
jgi:hypothetical protein